MTPQVDEARKLVRPRQMPRSKELRIRADTVPPCQNEEVRIAPPAISCA